jgi:heterotetrameric sarcosine oxidase gamma subunit
VTPQPRVTLQAQSALGAPFGAVSAVTGFNSGSATLRERADIGCVLLTAAVDAAEIATAASRAAGLDLPLQPGMSRTGPQGTAIWLSPRSWLLHCGIDQERELVTHLNEAFPDKLAHAAAFTDQLCWVELSGVPSLELLTEGTFLSLEPGGLPIGHAKRTLIAQVAAIVVRENDNVWLVAIERSRARYFTDWLIAAVAVPK